MVVGGELKQLHKRLVLSLVVLGTLLVFCALFSVPQFSNRSMIVGLSPLSDTENDNVRQITAGNAGTFNDIGMYLCRPDEPNPKNVYYASITVDDTVVEAQPTITAQQYIDDEWKPLPAEITEFWVDVNDNETDCTVFWYLRETAPAGVYGVSCAYEQNINGEKKKIEDIFTVLYTDDWNYIQVINNDGERRINNLFGDERTLSLKVNFNSGAARPNLKELATKTDGIPHDAIDNLLDIVSLDTMDITVKSITGTVYEPNKDFDWETDASDKSRVTVRFLKRLENDIYLVQFSSNANKRIVGQFVIDNTGAKGGVNLSQVWAVLMIFGGVLTLGAASAYLTPFVIIKVNETRVNKENERVDRMKNPGKYVESDKKSLKGIMSKVIYNLKTPAYKRKKDKEKEQEAKPVEEKVYTNRFTEMLRDRQEKRDFMRENNITSEEMERMKEAKEEAIKEEASSFAALRDDDEDDEIATFHAAEDEVSTLETGSYVKDGTTFAELDSLRDNQPQNGNDDGGN